MVVILVFLGVGVVGLLAGLPWQRIEQAQAGPQSAVTTAGAALLDALESARSTAAADVLPPREAVVAMAWRLQRMSERVSRIDALLAQPEFSPAAASSRRAELLRQGDPVAARLVETRLARLLRLVALRERLATELEELRELVVQLRVEAEACSDGRRDTAVIALRLLVEEVLERMDRLGVVTERFPEMPVASPRFGRIRAFTANLPTPRRIQGWRP